MAGTVPLRLQFLYSSCNGICYILEDIVLATEFSWLESYQGKTCWRQSWGGGRRL